MISQCNHIVMSDAITAVPTTEPVPDIDQVLAEFEARCDLSDPQQQDMLEAMKEHTRRLHQVRGDWNKPNSRRNWNAPLPRDKATAPLAIDEYR